MKKNILNGKDLFLIASVLNEIINGYRVENFENKFSMNKDEATLIYEKNHKKLLDLTEKQEVILSDYFSQEEILFFYNAITEVFMGIGIDKEDFYYRTDFTVEAAKLILEKFSFPMPESIKDDTCWNKPQYITPGKTIAEKIIDTQNEESIYRFFGDRAKDYYDEETKTYKFKPPK